MPRNCQLHITINYIDMKTNCLNMIICVFSLVCAHIDLCVIRGPPLPSQSFIRLSWRIKPRGEEKGWGRKVCVYLGQLPCRNTLMHADLGASLLGLFTPSLGCKAFSGSESSFASSPILVGKGQPTDINQAKGRDRVALSSVWRQN